MDIDIEKYILEHSSTEDPVLNELYRKTYTSVINPHMISGHIQGSLLGILVRMLSPSNILEIGTYTGYSAICMARALEPGGMVHTIEINDELQEISQSYSEKAGVKDRITFYTGDALDIMKEMKCSFDFVFIDGDKRQYPEYFFSAKKLLADNACIIADNVLWNGKVADPSADDGMTNGIRKFNSIVKNDPDMDNIIIPAGDGLMLMRKV
ncbi:MAG: O-methyltransferase [Bacteroidales bacterium]|nr:O-methyltransferase [Bacteroidales bacterium]